MSFWEHVIELRKRVVLCLWGILVCFLVTYHFSERIFQFLMTPLCETFQDRACRMIYTSVAEPFLVYLKVGIVGGVFVSTPWILYQLWLFISPGLKAKEKKWVVPFVLIGSLMFLGGALFGYFFIFPFAFEFFLSQAWAPIEPMLSMADSFCICRPIRTSSFNHSF